MCSGMLNPEWATAFSQMIVEPEARVADFAKAGADIISVHVESKATTHLDRVIHQVPSQSVYADRLQCPWSPNLDVDASCRSRGLCPHLPRWRWRWHIRPRGGFTQTVLFFLLLQIKDLGCKAGVVLNPATPLSSIEHVLGFVGA